MAKEDNKDLSSADSETPDTPVEAGSALPDGEPEDSTPSPLQEAEALIRGPDHHESPPCAQDQIAWQYLLETARMDRCVETVEILDFRRARRHMTLDFGLPDCDCSDDVWMIPAGFFGKTPVAPDLEVRDAKDAAIPVPTKPENMAITEAALHCLHSAGAIRLKEIPELPDLVHQVIFEEPFEARVARLLAESAMAQDDALLKSLLRSLEDRFLLWVPMHGQPRSRHEIQIARRQGLGRDQLLPRRRVSDSKRVETALGTIDVSFEAASGPREFVWQVAISRLQQAFGIAPIDYQHEVTEARRFSSFHLRVLAPEGMVVRDVGLEAPKAGAEDEQEPEMEEVVDLDGITIQGRESELGHLHCARSSNPGNLLCVTTLGIRDGVTSLWAGAVILTALLLWAMHRLAPPDLATIGTGQLEATVAILLVGPTLASVWAVRADSEVLGRMLLGARAILLLSAVLAIGTALSLDGFQPFHLSEARAVELYASASYFVAVFIVIGWVVTLPATWFLYRGILTTPRRSLAAVVGVSLLALVVTAHSGVPFRVSGFTLLGCGLFLSAVAVHPGRPSRIDHRGTAPVLAGIVGMGTLLGAGFFLGFYDDLLRASSLRPSLSVFLIVIFLAGLVAWYRSP